MSQWDTRLRRQDRVVLGSFDSAAHLFRQRARLVVLGGAVFLVPLVVVDVVLTVVAFDHFDGFDAVLTDRGFVGVESAALLAATLVQSLCAHLVGAFTAYVVIAHRAGDGPTLRRGLGLVGRRLPLLVLTWAVTHSWVFFVALLAVNSPSALLGVAILIGPLMAFFTAITLFVAPVIMGERADFGAVRRAMKLAGQRRGAAFGMVLLNAMMGSLVAGMIAALPAGLEATGLVSFGAFGSILSGVAAPLALLVVQPLTALAAAELYLQVRVHSEGLDIQLAADAAFGVGR